jgi:small multidrug resistance pump
MLKYWALLYAAIGFEVAGTLCLKITQGFSRPLPSAGVLLCYGVSLVLMSKAVVRVDVGVAYAIWSAVGIISIAVLSMVFFGESLTIPKVLSFLLIIAGVVSLSLSG